ncbi:hypothetical protein ACO0QE_000139 [Hanseniaspora vineae]
MLPDDIKIGKERTKGRTKEALIAPENNESGHSATLHDSQNETNESKRRTKKFNRKRAVKRDELKTETSGPNASGPTTSGPTTSKDTSTSKKSAKRRNNNKRKQGKGKSQDVANKELPQKEEEKELIFIVDPTCFTKGLGHVMQWVSYIEDMEKEAATSSAKRSNTTGPQKTKITLYLSTYTIEELNFLKTNRNFTSAIKSLKFIDTKFEFFDMEILEKKSVVEEMSWSGVLRDLFFSTDQSTSSSNELERASAEPESHSLQAQDYAETENTVDAFDAVLDKPYQRQLVKKLFQATMKIPMRYKKLIKSYHLLQKELLQRSKEDPKVLENTKVYIVSADIYVLQDLNQIFNGAVTSTDSEITESDQQDNKKIEILDILKADIMIDEIYHSKCHKVLSAENGSSQHSGNGYSSHNIMSNNNVTSESMYFKKNFFAPRGKGELWTP